MEDATVSKFKGEWSGVKDRRGFESGRASCM